MSTSSWFPSVIAPARAFYAEQRVRMFAGIWWFLGPAGGVGNVRTAGVLGFKLILDLKIPSGPVERSLQMLLHTRFFCRTSQGSFESLQENWSG